AAAKKASRHLARLGTKEKNAALEAVARAIEASTAEILEANAADVEAAKAASLDPAFVDKLTLNEQRVQEMADGVRVLAALPDPVGEVIEDWTLESGIRMEKRRVPLGVMAVVYEARPNVTVDAAAMCLKSGNAVVRRGSGDAGRSIAA